MDGFVPRRAGGTSANGVQRTTVGASGFRSEIGRSEQSISSTGPVAEQPQPRRSSISRQDLDDSLNKIHEDENKPAPKRRGLFRRKQKQPLTRKQKIIRRLAIFVAIILLALGGYVAVKAMLASNQVFSGNILDIFQNKALKVDENGRSNVLVFGTSEDDPGHEAGSLTDSIMVISIDQKNKNAYMMSLPRDLIVQYGMSCVAGNRGKINALYECYSDNGADEPAGAAALQKKAGDILGLDIQYYAHVNYTVVRDVVGALGTIDVTIESRDPRGVMDSNFDWKCRGGKRVATRAEMVKNCPPNGHFIDYPNGKVTLDAEHALYLAQARGASAPTYGLEQSNFDREKNQQKIVKAIREKAASAGTLADVGKVTGLIDALGNNLRTNFETAEVRTLMDLGKNIPSDQINSISLVKEGEALVDNGLGGVIPIAGPYEYSEIQAYVKKNISSDPVARENASVVVLNGSGVAGLAQTESDKLTDANYTVTETGNAPDATYAKTTIYRISTENTSGTAKALEKRYKTKITSGQPPFAVTAGTDFVVIVGRNANTESGSNE